MNPMRAVTIRYADGRISEGELAHPILVPASVDPFHFVSDFHIRANSDFEPICATLSTGERLCMLPERVEAKRKNPDAPLHITIEGPGQIWETFFCELDPIAKPQPGN